MSSNKMEAKLKEAKYTPIMNHIEQSLKWVYPRPMIESQP